MNLRRLGLGLCGCVWLISTGAQAAANPWFGTWTLRRADPSQRPETLVYSDAGQGAMRMVSVEDKSEVVTRFDGAAAPDVGAGDDRGGALAIKATSPTTYSWTYLRAGKPRAQGVNTLADDLRSFKEVSWRVGAPEAATTVVYDRR